jgi:hypothetical protein
MFALDRPVAPGLDGPVDLLVEVRHRRGRNPCAPQRLSDVLDPAYRDPGSSNAGPQRVRDFLAGSRSLPAETRNYVRAITGNLIEDWAKPARVRSDDGNIGEVLADLSVQSCLNALTVLKQPPYPLVKQPAYPLVTRRLPNINSVANSSSEFQIEHNPRVPTWCQHLHHPSNKVCGTVHEPESQIKISSNIKFKLH